MAGVFDGLKDVFSGEDKLQTHLFLLAVAGVAACFTSILQDITKGGGLLTIIFTLIFILCIEGTIFTYLTGFNASYINLKINEEEGLPSLSGNFWQIGWNGAILLFKYFAFIAIIYMLLLFLGIKMMTSGSSMMFAGITIIFVLCAIGYILIIPCLQYILIAFSRTFTAEGLFNPKILLCAIEKGWISAIWIGLQATFLNLGFMLIAYLIAMGISLGNGNLRDIIYCVFSGYIYAIINLIELYCLTDAFKNNIEPELIDNGLIPSFESDNSFINQ